MTKKKKLGLQERIKIIGEPHQSGKSLIRKGFKRYSEIKYIEKSFYGVINGIKNTAIDICLHRIFVILIAYSI